MVSFLSRMVDDDQWKVEEENDQILEPLKLRDVTEKDIEIKCFN